MEPDEPSPAKQGEKRPASMMETLFRPAAKRRAEMTPRERAQAAAKLSSTARILCMDGNDKGAYQKVLEALRHSPYDTCSYDVLGTLLERNGDEAGAVQARMWQAQNTKDPERKRRLYHQLYQRSQELGMEKLAVHNLAALLKLMRSREVRSKGAEQQRAAQASARLNLQRLKLLERICEWRMVEQGYRQWIARSPFDTRAVLGLCQMFSKLGLPEKSLAVADTFINRCVAQDNVPADVPEEGESPAAERTCQGFLGVCNLAAEVHLDAGRWGEVTQLVEKVQRLLNLDRLERLHPDLVVKHCVANLFRGDTETALRTFESAQESFAEIAEGVGFDELGFGELYFDFSQALLKLGYHNEALSTLEKIKDSAPIVAFSTGKCYAARAAQHSESARTLRQAGDEKAAEEEEARAKEEWGKAHDTFARVHSDCPNNVEARACLAEAKIKIATRGNVAAEDTALALLNLESVRSWTPEDTLRAAHKSLDLLRQTGRTDAARQVAIDIITACQREQPAQATSAWQRKGRFDQLLDRPSSHHPRQRPNQSVLLASSTARPLASALGSGGLATLSVSAGQDRQELRSARAAQIEEGARRMSEEKAIFKLCPLATRRREEQLPDPPRPQVGAKREPANDIANLESLEEDMLVHDFLARSAAVRRAVRLADSDADTDEVSSSLGSRKSMSVDGSASDDGAGEDAKEDQDQPRPALTAAALDQNQKLLKDEKVHDKVQSYLLNDFFTSLPNRFDGRNELDASGFPAFPAKRRKEHTGPRVQSLWHCGTVRQVLINGETGRDALFTIVRQLVDDLGAGMTDASVRAELAQTTIPLLYTVVSNRHRLFTSDEQEAAKQLVIAASFQLGDFKVAYSQIRRMVGQRKHHTNHFWNVLNAILLAQGPKVELRALFDTLRFHPHLMQCFPLFCILGNAVAYRHGSTKLAIGPLLQAHRLRRDDPMVALMIALQYLRLVMSRQNPNRHYVALQAFAFADTYNRLRRGVEPGSPKPSQPVESEVWYNLGRVYHQLGLAREAADYYRRCLALYDAQKQQRAAGALPPESDDDPQVSMHREAAYNLHLILRKSGNLPFANWMLRHYIVV